MIQKSRALSSFQSDEKRTQLVDSPTMCMIDDKLLPDIGNIMVNRKGGVSSDALFVNHVSMLSVLAHFFGRESCLRSNACALPYPART